MDLPVFRLKIPTFHGAGGPGSSPAGEEERVGSRPLWPTLLWLCGAPGPLTSPPCEVLLVTSQFVMRRLSSILCSRAKAAASLTLVAFSVYVPVPAEAAPHLG